MTDYLAQPAPAPPASVAGGQPGRLTGRDRPGARGSRCRGPHPCHDRLGGSRPERVEPAVPFAEMAGIVKRYDRVVALAGVDVAFARGEIHAIVGENGAGKTTLMQILAGVQQPDAGSIRVQGRPVSVGDVESAYRLGIAMVHQHFMLFPSLTVAENLTLGREPEHRGLFDTAAAERAVVELGERYAPHRRPAPAHRRALGRRPPARRESCERSIATPSCSSSTSRRRS